MKAGQASGLGSWRARGEMSERTYVYDAVEAGKGIWMVHRRWMEECNCWADRTVNSNCQGGVARMDEASLYGDYTAESAIKAAIERNSWA